MSAMSRRMTADRILNATKDSQIIVEQERIGFYGSFFADTVYGWNYLRNPNDKFMGCFWGIEGYERFNEIIRGMAA